MKNKFDELTETERLKLNLKMEDDPIKDLNEEKSYLLNNDFKPNLEFDDDITKPEEIASLSPDEILRSEIDPDELIGLLPLETAQSLVALGFISPEQELLNNIRYDDVDNVSPDIDLDRNNILDREKGFRSEYSPYNDRTNIPSPRD